MLTFWLYSEFFRITDDHKRAWKFNFPFCVRVPLPVHNSPAFIRTFLNSLAIGRWLSCRPIFLASLRCKGQKQPERIGVRRIVGYRMPIRLPLLDKAAGN